MASRKAHPPHSENFFANLPQACQENSFMILNFATRLQPMTTHPTILLRAYYSEWRLLSVRCDGEAMVTQTKGVGHFCWQRTVMPKR